MTIRKVILQPQKAEMKYSISSVLTDDNSYATVNSDSLKIYFNYNIPPGRTITSFKIYYKARSYPEFSSDGFTYTGTKQTYSMDFFDTKVRNYTSFTFLNTSSNNLYFSIYPPSSSYYLYMYYAWVEVEYEEPYGDISLEELTQLEKTQVQVKANLKTSYVYSVYSSKGKDGISYSGLEDTKKTLEDNNINIDDVYSIYLTINYTYNCNHSSCFGKACEIYQYYESDKEAVSGYLNKYTSSSALYMPKSLSMVYYKFYSTSTSYTDNIDIKASYYTITTMSPPAKLISKLNIGENNISKAYLGNTEVIKAYLGDVEVFSK